MASFNIHLAVGKRYLEKTKDPLNEEEFLRGIVNPDLAQDKNKSHYSKSRDKTNLPEYLSGKVNLFEYLESEYDNSDYHKGMFVHLLTDYLFFNDFFDEKYISEVSYSNFSKDLYYGYKLTNEYLEKKYNLDLSLYKKEINFNIDKDNKEKDMDDNPRLNILPQDKLETFIERVSDINLDNYISGIKTSQHKEG